jgi:hypothetical protein
MEIEVYYSLVYFFILFLITYLLAVFFTLESFFKPKDTPSIYKRELEQ